MCFAKSRYEEDDLDNQEKRQDQLKSSTKFQFTPSQRRYNNYIKRGLDALCAAIAFILLLPVFIIVPIAIMIEEKTVKAPAFFVQSRRGLDGKLFKIYKFRSMYSHAPCAMPTNEFYNSDVYITKVGSFLRKTSLDELPQLLNVLKGEMSIVGPRPLIPEEAEIDRLRQQLGIYQLRPGITGLAQVSGRDNMDIDTKTNFDRHYLENISFLFDLNLLWRTISVVLKRENIAF